MKQSSKYFVLFVATSLSLTSQSSAVTFSEKQNQLNNKPNDASVWQAGADNDKKCEKLVKEGKDPKEKKMKKELKMKKKESKRKCQGDESILIGEKEKKEHCENFLNYKSQLQEKRWDKKTNLHQCKYPEAYEEIQAPDQDDDLLGSSEYEDISSGKAYTSYHNYYPSFNMNTVSCSDGQNGLITRWGYSDMSEMYPAVSAVSNIAWNSPNCGKCYKLTKGSRSTYVTGVDQCGPPPSGKGFDLHFDLSPGAFKELYGSTSSGVNSANYETVASSFCKGNKGPN